MIGQQVGKYQILDRVGRGGMGTVYRALDSMLQREVAIKVLNAELNDPEVAKRFRAEAVTVARLNHPGIATIFELFEHEGQWLMVMEFVRGETLEHMVERMGGLSPQRAAEFCMQALTALAHAHSMGVIHRDLKPANLMITENGVVKIMDFGIARVSGSEHLTGVGFMMGTPAYMSPEQVMGHEIDSRADLYSMGVVFYRLTTAKLPFRGDTPFAMAHSQVHDPPTPIGMQRSDLPAWADQVVARALAKSPEARFQSAVEFYEAFSRCLAGLPMTTLSGPVIPGPGDPTGMVHTPGRMPSGAYGMRTPGPMNLTPVMNAPTPPMPGLAQPTDVTRQVETGRPAPVITPKASKTGRAAAPINPIAAGLIAAVVLLIGVVVFLLLNRGSEAPPPAVTENTAPVVPPPAVPDPVQTLPADPVAVAPPVTPPPPPPVTPAPPVAQTPPASARANAPARGAAAPARGAPGQTTGAPGQTTGATGQATGAGVASSGAGAQPPATPPAAAGTAAGTPPTPPAVADTPIKFDNLKAVAVSGTKSTEQDASLSFEAGSITVSPRRGQALATVPYRSIARATYVHAKNPAFDASLPGPPADLEPPPGIFGLPTRHWLVIQTRTSFTMVHLAARDVAKVLETLEARTGVKVDRPKSE